MIKKKKIPIKSLVLILILVELICLVFAGILGEPGNDINLKTASWMNHPWRCFNQYTLISLGCGLTGWVFFLRFIWIRIATHIQTSNMVLQNGMIRTLQINAWPILSIRKITAFFPNT